MGGRMHLHARTVVDARRGLLGNLRTEWLQQLKTHA